VRPRFTLDVWEEYPRVTFGFEESEDGVQWKRMRLRDAGLDMVVEALRHDTRIHNLEVAYDVTKALN